MSKKSKFVKMSLLWEDYQIDLVPSPRAGYDVIFTDIDTEYPSDPYEVKRRHLSDHDAAMGLAISWAHQIEEGRVQKRKRFSNESS